MRLDLAANTATSTETTEKDDMARVIAELFGLGAVALGVWTIYPPAALIAVGVGIVLYVGGRG